MAGSGSGSRQVSSLVEEREVELVSLADPTTAFRRKGWFLKPSPGSPFLPLPHKLPTTSTCTCTSTNPSHWASKVLFNGWASPLRQWSQWVHKLQPVYENHWRNLGIFDAIMTSVCKIEQDTLCILGLARYWCSETNTFVFPQAEATVTLEDVMILGGFPVLGECVRIAGSLPHDLERIEMFMIGEHRVFYRMRCRKASHGAWLAHFMEREGDEIEHIAFLSLWLSRHVLPQHPRHAISRNVFPMAIRLARAMRLALAPAVLASMYRDLCALREYVISSRECDTAPPIALWAPLHLLQLWVWEHFVKLRPKRSPHFICRGEPRAARWNHMKSRAEIGHVTSILQLLAEFRWRPYAADLDNWRPPSFYRDRAGWIRVSEANDEDVCSFARCLSACELVGVDCIETYHPHRVAMQFGFDQDVTGCAHHANNNQDWELAWATYDKCGKDVKLYIPPRLFEPDVTLEYFAWWKDTMSGSGYGTEADVQRESSSESITWLMKKGIAKKRKKKIKLMSERKKQKLDYDLDVSLSDSSGPNKCSKGNVNFQMPYLVKADNLGGLVDSVRGAREIEGETQKVEIGEASASDRSGFGIGGVTKRVNEQSRRASAGESRTERVNEQCKRTSAGESRTERVNEQCKRTSAGESQSASLKAQDHKHFADMMSGTKETRQCLHAFDCIEEVQSRKLGQAPGSYKLSMDTREIIKEVHSRKAGESSYDPIELEDLEGIIAPEEVTPEMERCEDTGKQGNGADVSTQFRKLKQEIYAFHSRVMEWKSRIMTQLEQPQTGGYEAGSQRQVR